MNNIKRQECTVYARIVGWITPLKNWNKGKKSEWDDRVTYKTDDTNEPKKT